MPAVCLCFQVHQPARLRSYPLAEVGQHAPYHDEVHIKRTLRRLEEKCYLPANKLLTRLFAQYGERCKVSFSVPGTTLEQFALHAPNTLASFQELAASGNVEFLGETYHHSLAFLYQPEEFVAQVALHSQKMEETFGQRPQVFKNTLLLYRDDLPDLLAPLGFRAFLCEAAAPASAKNAAHYLYQSAGTHKAKLLVRNTTLSQALSLYFTDPQKPYYPLTAQKFVGYLATLGGSAEVITLVLDYENFGEYHPEKSNIFKLLEELPNELEKQRGFTLLTPSEVLDRLVPRGPYSVPETSLLAEATPYFQATDNEMQRDALRKAYHLHRKVTHKRSASLLETWRQLQAANMFYFMAEKLPILQKFNPFESTFDAYIAYQNILQDFEQRLLYHDFHNHS